MYVYKYKYILIILYIDYIYVVYNDIHDFPCHHAATMPAISSCIRSGAIPLVQFDVDLLVRVPVHMWCTSPRSFFRFGNFSFVNRLTYDSTMEPQW